MNEPFALTGARVFLDGRFCDGVSVVVASGRILQILKDSGLPSDLEKLDLNGCYLIPGMIDLQVNGAAGCMMNVNPTLEGLKDMELQLLREGTTGFLAAVPTSSDGMCRKVFRLACLQEVRSGQSSWPSHGRPLSESPVQGCPQGASDP